jgi:hypothetical protein
MTEIGCPFAVGDFVTSTFKELDDEEKYEVLEVKQRWNSTRWVVRVKGEGFSDRLLDEGWFTLAEK